MFSHFLVGGLNVLLGDFWRVGGPAAANAACFC